ncbi:MAG: RNA polymerase sigma factor [Crocinitomix sp.]|nr:RNA polymerase sigma factor [Crocinitomix sp.]
MKIDHLIPLIQKGDRKAFKELYEAYAPIFKGMAFRYTGDLDQCNDLIQETFIKIFKNINTYTGEGNFEGWMKRILINNCLNYLQKEKKYILESTDTVLEQTSTNWNEAISSMTFDEILAILDKLPLGYKTVFNLSVLDNYSHQEIGEMLGISESASRSQLTKAKKKLKEELEKINVFSFIA